MNMQDPSRTCVSQQQVTWSVLACRIVFDDCTPGNGVADLLHADLAEDTLGTACSENSILPVRNFSRMAARVSTAPSTGSLYNLRTLTKPCRSRMLVGLALATSAANRRVGPGACRRPAAACAGRGKRCPAGQDQAPLGSSHGSPSRQAWKDSLNSRCPKNRAWRAR